MNASTFPVAKSSMTRPRLVGIDRALAVADAVDTTRRLGVLDPHESVVLAAELELAVLAVIEHGDRLVELLLERAALTARENRHVAPQRGLNQGVCLPCRRRQPCPTFDEIRARGRELSRAIAAARKRLGGVR